MANRGNYHPKGANHRVHSEKKREYIRKAYLTKVKVTTIAKVYKCSASFVSTICADLREQRFDMLGNQNPWPNETATARFKAKHRME